MTAPYSENYKKEVLMYARDNSVAAAAKKYGISRQLIGRWNKQMQIYRPQTAEYPLELRRRILQYAATNGVKAAAEKYGVSAGIIKIWNNKMRVYAPKRTVFNEQQKLDVLRFARDFGVMRATDKFGLNPSTIIRWNNRYNIYNPLKSYDRDEIIDILTYVRDHGITAASQHFDISKFTITRWNKEYKIYKKRDEPLHAPRTEDEQREILRYALEIYNSLPAGSRSAHMVFNEIADEFDVSADQISNWNKKFKIVPVRVIPKRDITQTEIDTVQDALNQSRGRIAATSRKTGISARAITKLKKDKKIKFNRAAEKLTATTAVGRKKATLISALIQSLRMAKEQN